MLDSTISSLLTNRSCHAGAVLLTEFQKILPADTICDDDILIKCFASLLYEEKGVKVPELFTVTMIGDAESRQKSREHILGLYDCNPMRFLRFGLPLLIKDFSDFAFVFKGCFHDNTAALAVVLLSIPLANKSDNLTENDYQYICEKLIENGWHHALSPEHLITIIKSLKEFSLNDREVSLKSSTIVNSPDNAIDATRTLRDELAPVGTESQLETLCILYSHQDSSAESILELMRSRGIEIAMTKDNDLRFGENKANQEKRNERLERMKILKSLIGKYTNPLDLLCAFNQKKKTPQVKKHPLPPDIGAKVIRATYDPYRKTDNRLECGLMYNIFTSSLGKKSNVLVVFPSPFWIRKYVHDEMLKGIRTCFVVESESEKALLNLHLHGQNESRFMSEERKELSVVNLDDILPDAEKSRKWPYTDVIVFSTKSEKNNHNPLADFATRITRLENRPSILCICADSAFRNKETFIGSMVAKKQCFNSVLFVPVKINDGMPPKHKSICEIGNKSNDHTVFLFPRYISGTESAGRRSISFDGKSFKESKNLSISGFIASKRIDIRNYVSNPVKKERIKKAFEVKFTQDISFFYTKSKSATGKITAYVTIRNNGKKVEDSKLQPEFDNTEEIKPWILKNYVDSVRKERKPPRTVVIRDIICEAYRGKPLHLESILKLYRREDLDLSQKELEMLFRLSDSHTCMGNTLDAISADLFSEAILNLFEEKSDRSEVLNALAKVLVFAVEKNHCKENVLQNQLKYSDREAYMFSVLRSTLVTKTLTKTQDKEIYGYLKTKICHDSDYIYLGVLLKFFCALETNVVRALQWQDLKEVRRFGFWQLFIYKQVGPQENAQVKAMDKISDLRCIPCPDLLKNIICFQRDRLIREKQYDPNRYIVTDNEESSWGNPVSSGKLKAAIRDTIDKLKLEDTEIIISDGETTNLSRYVGDLLRENGRFMLKEFGKCNNFEIAYILGNTPDNTAARNYIDLRNEASQLSLYVKMRRIDAMIASSSSYKKPDRTSTKLSAVKLSNENVRKIPERDGTSSPLLVNLYATPDKKPYSISVSSRFGVDMKASSEDT